MQVYEVGTQTMLSSGAVYPVFSLMKDNNVAIDWNDLIGPVKTYSSSGGNLYSMAFNSSTPILYYNKDLFKKAGLPDKAPATWDEVESMAKKLVASGAKCGYSTAWPSCRSSWRRCTPTTTSRSPITPTASTAWPPVSRSTAPSV